MLKYLRFSQSILFQEIPSSSAIKQSIRMLATMTGNTAADYLGTPAKMRDNPIIKKIDTPEFQSIFTDGLKQLKELFERNAFELRVAGGAVRDILMQQKPKDVDFATTATPAEMKDMFEKENIRMLNMKGEKHGTITARIDEENFEVTTLRIDVCTDGRHAEVKFTTNWQLDANRRDLTINSMFLGLDGTLYDYFYGYDDLEARRVLFVGDASIRIQEDYLRILRYFRFYGRIATEATNHDEKTLNAIKENVSGLARISGERIWSELQKIVVGNFNKELMLEIINCGIGKYCGLPTELNITEFQRVCDDLQSFKESHQPILYLIALLNDCDEGFKLHERLKFSAYERDLILFIIQQRDKVDKDFVSLHDYQKLCMDMPLRRSFVEQLLKYCNKLELYTELTAWNMPKFPITGKALISAGCEPTPALTYITKELRSVWYDSKFTMTADELLQNHFPAIKAKADLLPPQSPRNYKRKSS